MGPLGQKAMSFTQWLQFVFLPAGERKKTGEVGGSHIGSRVMG